MRPIDADHLKRWILSRVFKTQLSIADVIDQIDREDTILKALPPAQPEMVKCNKCRYVYYDKEFGNYWCNRMSDSFKVEADGYCKWGK